MNITRDSAWELLCRHVASESLRGHCLAVEAAMRACAKKHGEDAELWGACGLLHDMDYEAYPDKHPFVGVEILRGEGYPEEIIQAILGHATYSGVARESAMAKCLFAVDELAGFIVACALVRPGGFFGMEPKSVKKKLKNKAFAAKVNREEITQAIAELGVDADEHIALVIAAIADVV